MNPYAQLLDLSRPDNEDGAQHFSDLMKRGGGADDAETRDPDGVRQSSDLERQGSAKKKAKDAPASN